MKVLNFDDVDVLRGGVLRRELEPLDGHSHRDITKMRHGVQRLTCSAAVVVAHRLIQV